MLFFYIFGLILLFWKTRHILTSLSYWEVIWQNSSPWHNKPARPLCWQSLWSCALWLVCTLTCPWSLVKGCFTVPQNNKNAFVVWPQHIRALNLWKKSFLKVRTTFSCILCQTEVLFQLDRWIKMQTKHYSPLRLFSNHLLFFKYFYCASHFFYYNFGFTNLLEWNYQSNSAKINTSNCA